MQTSMMYSIEMDNVSSVVGKDVTFEFFCLIDSRMLSNRLLTDSRILGLYYGSEKVTRTNMIEIA